TVGPLLETAMHGILGAGVPSYELKIWHGFTVPLAMSFTALAGGISLYVFFRPRTLRPTPLLSHLNAKRAFDVVNVALVRGAGRVSRFLFSRRLQAQLVLVVLVAMAVALLPFAGGDWSGGERPLTPLDPLFALLWVAGAACAIGAAFQAKFHRLAALIMTGGAGLVTCLTFAWFSAPDLALTQLAVEVVTVVLILLGLRWLPRRLELEEFRLQTLRARARRT